MELINVLRSRQDWFFNSNFSPIQNSSINHTLSPYTHKKKTSITERKKTHIQKLKKTRTVREFEEFFTYLWQLERGGCRKKEGGEVGLNCQYSILLCRNLAPQFLAPLRYIYFLAPFLFSLYSFWRGEQPIKVGICGFFLDTSEVSTPPHQLAVNVFFPPSICSSEEISFPGRFPFVCPQVKKKKNHWHKYNMRHMSLLLIT